MNCEWHLRRKACDVNIVTFRIVTFNIVTFNILIVTFNNLPFNIVTFNILPFNIVAPNNFNFIGTSNIIKRSFSETSFGGVTAQKA